MFLNYVVIMLSTDVSRKQGNWLKNMSIMKNRPLQKVSFILKMPFLSILELKILARLSITHTYLPIRPRSRSYHSEENSSHDSSFLCIF